MSSVLDQMQSVSPGTQTNTQASTLRSLQQEAALLIPLLISRERQNQHD